MTVSSRRWAAASCAVATTPGRRHVPGTSPADCHPPGSSAARRQLTTATALWTRSPRGRTTCSRSPAGAHPGTASRAWASCTASHHCQQRHRSRRDRHPRRARRTACAVCASRARWPSIGRWSAAASRRRHDPASTTGCCRACRQRRQRCSHWTLSGCATATAPCPPGSHPCTRTHPSRPEPGPGTAETSRGPGT